MSFKRFDAEDLVVSAEPVSAPVWSTAVPTLTTFFTSSVQESGTSGTFYLNVYQTSSEASAASTQFAVTFGHKYGSGSNAYNSAVAGKSPSSTIYGQYRNLVLGDEETDITFGGVASDHFAVLAIDRDRYKESLLPGAFNLKLTNGSDSLYLTDNSLDVSTVTFNDAGRVYQIVSGSNGAAYTGTGYTASSGSYGLFLPDVGVVMLNTTALGLSGANGGLGISFNLGSAAATPSNFTKIFNAIKTGASFQLNYKETISSQYAFVRVRNSEYNYSTNPSYITGSGDLRISNMIDAPQTYITTVGMYNDNNELLAVAKLSRPLLKDFTKEALVRIKLDF